MKNQLNELLALCTSDAVPEQAKIDTTEDFLTMQRDMVETARAIGVQSTIMMEMLKDMDIFAGGEQDATSMLVAYATGAPTIFARALEQFEGEQLGKFVDLFYRETIKAGLN